MSNNAPTPDSIFDDVETLLGINPTKEPRVTKDTFDEILAEVSVERQEKAKARARILVDQVMTEAANWSKEEKAFAEKRSKFLKEFQKTLNRVRALANGTPEPKVEEVVSGENS